MAYAQVVTASKQVNIGTTRFRGIFVSSTTSGTVAVYDSATSSTSDPLKIATVTPAAGSWIPAPDPDGATFTKGLYVVIANTLSITVYYD